MEEENDSDSDPGIEPEAKSDVLTVTENKGGLQSENNDDLRADGNATIIVYVLILIITFVCCWAAVEQMEENTTKVRLNFDRSNPFSAAHKLPHSKDASLI